MPKIMEQLLKPPSKAKHDARQDGLDEETVTMLRKNEISPKQWIEINKRFAEMEAGDEELITLEELADYLTKTRNALSSQKK